MMVYDKEQWRATNDNGQIQLSKLSIIQPGFFDPDLGGPGMMHPEASRAMSAMLWEGREAGHVAIAPKYSYRTLPKQWEKWRAFEDRGFTPPIVAFPGTSNHGWAVTVDFSWSSNAAIVWMHANCQRFGFKFDVPSENWHCTYQEGGVRPAVLKAEESMAKADEIEKGVNAFIVGNEPNDDGLARRVYRALDKAAKLPKPSDPTDPGEPGDHTHKVPAGQTGPVEPV